MTGFSQPERRALARSQTAQAHPDADLLNAFSEQTLTAREREQVLAHLAACPACREVVSLSAPPMEHTVPELDRAASAWKWPVMRWGAVAASAAIVVIAVSLRIFQETGPTMKQVATETAPMSVPAQETQKAITAQAPPSVGMKAPQVRYEKVVPKPEQQLAARVDAPSANIMLNKMNAPMGASEQGSAMGGVVTGAQMRTAKENESETKKDERVLADNISTDSDALAKLKTAPPPPPPSSPGVPAKSAALPPPAAETVTVQSAAPTVDTAPSVTSAEMVPRGRQANTLQKAAPMVARDSKMNAFALDQRWQVTPEGYLLSSTDEGKNWMRQLPDLRFTHVQTIGMHVWACGPDGILHSIDGGLDWSKVIPTENKTMLQGDITSIVFTDIKHGKLGTSKGETWTTTDAGRTWKKQ